MQKGFFLIIQLLFFAVIVLGLTLVVMGSSGGTAVPVLLGVVLFMLGLGAFRHPGQKGEGARRRLVEIRETLMTNKGGAITLGIIAMGGMVIGFLAAGV
ncbi:MAG: hypothetical protein ACO26Y_03475 [Burkholderiaceae bacterium]|mgnify:FL=1